MSALAKAMYLPLSVTTSVAGGLLASAVFSRIWQRFDDSGEPPPDPRDLQRSGRQALIGAALQGLVFGLVRAATARAGARGYRAVTRRSR